MCGIAGVLALGGGVPDPANVRAMAAALAHRGPDGEGFFEEPPVALGHRRLAILDVTDAGRQTVDDSSGRYAIVFNGEIYNYLELRAELESTGSIFRSRSDTEVLLEGYARWGERVLPRLNGMFAFAIWDRESRRLFCARDRFGEKPLFYAFEPGREFRFASELKALVSVGAGKGRPRADVLFRFLAFGHAGTRAETFFEGVDQVPPAHVLSLRRYWAPDPFPAPFAGSEAEAAERTASLLEDAVRIRLRSDVPVGTSLSGGLDSSTVVGLVSRLLRKGEGGGVGARQHAFSSCFPGDAIDESRWIAEAAGHAGVESHRVMPSGAGLVDDLPAMVEAQEEPFGGPSVYAQWRVMGLARDRGVVVLLDGQGADDVFAGYHFYFQDFWWGLLRTGRVAVLRREMRDYDAVHGAGKARPLLQSALRARSPRWLRRLKGGPDLPWLASGFARRGAAEAPPRPSGLLASLRESRETRMLPHLLRHADRNSIAFSREVRLPFLDHRLVEFVDTLPDDLRLRGATTKRVLREAIRGVVPESVRTRTDKIGFAVPFLEWMRGPLDGLILDMLASRRFRERGIHDVPFLEGARKRLKGGEDRWADVLWNALAVELWMRAFVDGAGGRG